MVSKTTYDETVALAVARGLNSRPKHLPSWLFYDETGDRIFQQIMRMPEYYPTRCEYDILKEHRDDLLNHFTAHSGSFSLIELGAGDGLKTEILLKHFIEHGAEFTYLPVDISANALGHLAGRLSDTWPELPIEPLNKTYDEALDGVRNLKGKRVLLFMGANIGNFPIAEASQFMKKIGRNLSTADRVLIGFDLRKDPRVIQAAYDDPGGLTQQFNLNLLTRLNRDLGAEFLHRNFSHYPFYDAETGAMKSFLISMKEQSVRIGALERSVRFGLWETIQTEVSQKYDVAMIEELLTSSGFQPVDFFFDTDSYFCDVLAAPA